MKISPINNSPNFGAQKCHCDECGGLEQNVTVEKKPESKRSKLLVPALIGATTMSILGTMTLISKGRMGTGKISKLLNKEVFGEKLFAVKNFNMFKSKTYSQLVKEMKYGPLDVITIASSSVASGLGVGCLLDDKKNRKTKVKESISQIVGNIIFPIICVTGASVLMSKGIEKQLPVIKQVANKVGNRVPKIVASALGFLAGVVGGNKVANQINKSAFQTPKAAPKRGLKPADLSGHIDDGCTTVALAGKGVKVCEAVARVIPAALTICGISTGLAKES